MHIFTLYHCSCMRMFWIFMMTSSNDTIFRVTGPLWGESTGHRWIPLTKASDTELWYFLCAGQTVEQTPETPVNWNAIALVMTSLLCYNFFSRCIYCYHHHSGNLHSHGDSRYWRCLPKKVCDKALHLQIQAQTKSSQFYFEIIKLNFLYEDCFIGTKMSLIFDKLTLRQQWVI